MNNKLNIREILKGHKNHKCYSPLCGECWLCSSVTDKTNLFKSDNGSDILVFNNGKCNSGGVCLLFPSRELYEKYPLDAAKAWEEWVDENAKNAVKTWEDIEADPENYGGTCNCIADIESERMFSIAFGNTLTKSAIALLKIRKLIDVAYGGNPKFDDKLDQCKEFWFISFREESHELFVQKGYGCIDQVAFHTEEQAEDFISHPSNRCLIRDFYMV